MYNQSPYYGNNNNNNQYYQQQSYSGILLVRPISGKLNRDTELIGSMDCYCQVMIGQQNQSTHVHKGSGKNPSWRSQLQFKIQDETSARIIVWDKEMVKSDDIVGETSIDLPQIFERSSQQGTIPLNLDLFFKNKAAGTVQIELEFLVDGPSMGHKAEKRKGMVIVKPTSAILTKDTELVGQMDPYVVVKLGNYEKKSKVHNSGGKNPQWNDIIEIRRTDEYFLELTVLDKDVLTSDTVGEAQLNLQDLFNRQQVQQQQVDLYYKGKQTGQLFLNLEWMPDTEQRSGTLIARPLSASLIRDTELVGKMDPYCVITIGNQREQTNIHSKGGQQPRWADELQFERIDEFEAIVEVFDEDVTSDDKVGTGSIALQDIFKQGKKQKEIQLFYKDKSSGTVQIDWEWHPDIENRPGILNVRAIEATLQKDTEFMGKMDPFLQIQIGDNKQKTTAVQGGGKNPKWNQPLTIRRKNEHFAYITVFDEDVVSNDMVGQGKFALYDVFRRGKKRTQVNIKYKNKISGTAILEWQWTPDEELRTGTILVRPIQAKLERDTELFGKMDCYTSITIGNQTQKTGVSEGSGKFPKWSDNPLSFKRKDEYQAQVRVLDSDVTTDDLVGETSFSLFDVFQARTLQKWVKIFYKKEKIAGQVYLEWQWVPDATAKDKEVENRVRYISLLQGQRAFENNMTQFMMALHNFDKLTLDDNLYQIFEGIVEQDNEKILHATRDNLKAASSLYCEGFSDLSDYFLSTITEYVPTPDAFLQIAQKFRKYVSLSEIFKYEIQNLTGMPSCFKSIEIIQQQLDIYELNPKSFKATPYQIMRNEMEIRKAQGDYSRIQTDKPLNQAKNYSNSINQLQNQDYVNQSRDIAQKTFQGHDDDQYYYSTQKSRLKLGPGLETQDRMIAEQMPYQQNNLYNESPSKYNARDWLQQNPEDPDDNIPGDRVFDYYEGGSEPVYTKDQLQQQYQKNQNHTQNDFWHNQQSYYHDPSNLPNEYQSQKTKKLLRDQQQRSLQYSTSPNKNRLTDQSQNFSSPQRQPMPNHNYSQGMAPDLDNSSQKPQFQVYKNKQQQQPLSSSSLGADRPSPLKQHQLTQSQGQPQKKRGIFDPMVKSQYAQPNNNYNNSRIGQSKLYNSNMPQINEVPQEMYGSQATSTNKYRGTSLNNTQNNGNGISMASQPGNYRRGVGNPARSTNLGQTYGSPNRVKKERTLFQSLFW